MEIIVAVSPHDAARMAAEWMARRIRSSVRLRGTCKIAVSGGSTPVPMFDALATMDLPWPNVHIYQVDERVAPDGHADRNAVQLLDHLVIPSAIPSANVHLMPVTASSLRRAAARYATALGGAPLDIVHLGIGDDGHTASWPPGDPVIDNTDPVAMTAEFNGRVRMTITPQVVNAGRARFVLVVGREKADPLAGWLLHRADLPIERVRRTKTVVIADEAATMQLHPLLR